MERRLAVLLGVVLCASARQGSAAQHPVPAEWAKQGRAIAMRFMAKLREELLSAVAAGGPVNAIGVCREKAPEIGARHSRETGFRVGRTSLRVRNPRNAPDAWEAQILETFRERTTAGEAAAGLEHSEVVEQGGRRVFRQLLAIPMGELCLGCHGESLAPEVQRAVGALYPEDRAVGFRLGEVRGAFTLSRDLE